MTKKVESAAEKISSWAQILIKELHSMKSHMKERMQYMKNYTDYLYIFMTDW